jgi:hypothetical protein
MSIFFYLLALSYAAWAALFLGVPRHYAHHFGTEPASAKVSVARASGWLLSLLGLLAGVAAMGWGMGSVAWAISWMLTAMVWTLLQAYRPRLARWLAALLLFAAFIVFGYPLLAS